MKHIVLFFFALWCSCSPAVEIAIDASSLKADDGWAREIECIRGAKPGAVAEGGFKVDQPGSFYFWMKTKNFGDNWRTAEVFINGKSIGVFGDVFGVGQTKAGWGWCCRKRPLVLRAGENQIKIVSVKTMCRIDEIVLTDDKNFSPAARKKSAKKSGSGNLIADPGHLPISPKLDGMFPRPKGKKGGPAILMIGGMRPWMTNTLAREICRYGADLYLINGTYMGGMSGASIKITPQDPVEPTPLNYLPFEFNQLDRYKVVFLSALSAENQTRVLGDRRLEQLKKYVQNGGNLVLTVNTPEILADVTPVELGDLEPTTDSLFVRRPEGARFSSLPKKWRNVDPYRVAAPKKDARVLAWLENEKGEHQSVYAAIWKYGKGNVLFFNNDYNRRNENIQFFRWAYRYRLIAALLGEAGDFQLTQPEETESHIQPKMLDQADVTITAPAMTLEKVPATVTVDGNIAKFSNGYVVAVGDKGLDITFPGAAKPYLRQVKFPAIGYPKAVTRSDDTSTGEATNQKSDFHAANVKLQVKTITGGDQLTITLANADDSIRLDWIFVTGKADVDGRSLAGIGEKIIVHSLGKKLLNNLQLNYRVDVGNKRFRRFACYQPPRGYNEYDLSGKGDAELRSWGFFATGQPFTWIEGENAVLCEFVDELFPVSFNGRTKKGDPCFDETINFHYGRVKAPQKSAIFWHMAMDKKYDTSNDWIALYQFLRHVYRVKAGFPEIPACPTACYSDMATDTEIDEIIQAAKEFGYKIIDVPLCPLQIEDFTIPATVAKYERIKKAGLIAYPWHPCCHTPGQSPLVQQHPEWFIHDENGKIAGYFGGHYRTADMDHPEFRKWYQNVIDTMLDHGVGVCWYDMGGSASGTYNFATPESRVGLWPQMEIYKYYYDRGHFVVTEGMNPCVLDGYIFRADSYNRPLRGREFPFIGASSIRDAMYFDYFRTSMYGYFIKTPLDAWASKFESHPGELAYLQKIKNYMPAINAALDNGMPFIRETPFGTTWTAEKGAAIFCFDGVKNLQVSLPENFVPVSMTLADGKTTKLDEKIPKNVEPGTIILIEKR